MRTTLAIVAVAVVGLASSSVSADACSARGRWCGYPNWAANAFEDKTGRAPLPDRPIGVTPSQFKAKTQRWNRSSN